MSNWGDLPLDLARKIGEHVEFYEEFERFGQICSGWRRAWKEANSSAPSKQTPWLMLTEPPRTSNRRLYNLYNATIRHAQLTPPPEFVGDAGLNQLFDENNSDWRYFSSRGWLISVSEFTYHIFLHNPWTAQVIDVPYPPSKHNQIVLSFDDDYLRLFYKFVLSEPPTSSTNFWLAMKFYNSVFLWKYGEETWIHRINNYYFEDVNFCKGGQFYAVSDMGHLVCYGSLSTDKDKPPTPILNVDFQWGRLENLRMSYVAETDCDDTLFVVRREANVDEENEERYETKYFEVWEVNVTTGEATKFDELRKTHMAIFVGYSSTFSLDASLVRGCKPNCIYYTDDLAGMYLAMQRNACAGCDIGVYDLGINKKIKDFFDAPFIFSHVTPHLWVEAPQ